MKVETVAVGSLTLFPGNPRTGNIDLIATSLKEYGQYKPLVVNKNNQQILAGNHTYQAAQKLGWKTIAVTYLDVDDATAKKIVALDNKASDTGGYDNEALLNLLTELEDLDFTGYDNDDLTDLMDYLEHPYEFTTISTKDLKSHPLNYQQHPADQIQHLIKSIETHGFYRNIVVANDNTILAGHGVVKAAMEMGRKRVPIIRLDIDPNDERALKVLTSDNEINNLAEVDDRQLTELLKNIMLNGDQGLEGTGFNVDQLSALAINTRPANELRDKNEVAEWLGMPDYETKPDALKIIMSFETAEDRQEFADTLGYIITDKTKSLWYPDKAKADPASIRITDQ